MSSTRVVYRQFVGHSTICNQRGITLIIEPITNDDHSRSYAEYDTWIALRVGQYRPETLKKWHTLETIYHNKKTGYCNTRYRIAKKDGKTLLQCNYYTTRIAYNKGPHRLNF